MAVPELIVMLTYNDITVDNAYDVFNECILSKANCYGIKEYGINSNNMKKLVSHIKDHNKTAILEVVTYTEDDCLNGVRLANECGFDIVMGTRYFESVHDYCRNTNIKYIPFIGNVHGRPSVLEGSVDEIEYEAKRLEVAGVTAFDLLGYRYKGNTEELTERLISVLSADIYMAGNIDSFEKLDMIKKFHPAAFTIGSAFFDRKFGNNMVQQINTVIEYMEK